MTIHTSRPAPRSAALPVASPAVLVALAAALSAAPAANGQACPAGEMFEHPGVRTIPDAVDNGLFTVDVNGDGSPDLLTRSHTAIAAHLNDGTGSFTPPVESPLHGNFSDRFHQALTIDAEGDGDPDLVVREWGSNGLPPLIEVYINDGAGNFAFDHAIPVDPGADRVHLFPDTASGDYNGDGLTDLLVTFTSPGPAYVYINDNGTFGGARWTVPLTDSPDPAGVIEALDINQDGMLDLVLRLPDGSYATTLGSPAGLTTPLPSPVMTAPIIRRPLNDDFDRDGFTDIFFATNDPGHLPHAGIYFGNADGTFDAPVEVPGAGPYYNLVFADPTSSESQPSWIIEAPNNAASRLTVGPTRTITTDPLLDTEGNPVPEIDAVTDVDGDGDGDMIADNRVYTLQPDGTFEPDPVPYLAPNWGDLVGVDFNNDGAADNAAVRGTTPDGDSLIQLALSNGAGGYSLSRGLSDRPLWPSANSSTFVDINGDGIPDAIGTSIMGEEWAIVTAIGSPGGQYTSIQETPTGITSGWSSIAVTTGDHDGDGLTDLIAAEPRGTEVFVFHGDANGNFGPAVEYDLPNTGITPDNIRLAAADLDNDGGLDLLLSSAGGANRGFVYWQDPQTREYTGFTQYNNARPSKPDVADLDNDGFLDFMFGNELNQNGTSKVQWNNGDRTFTGMTLGDHARLVAVGDLNNDGIGDVAGTRPAAIYLSDGATNGTPNQFVEASILYGDQTLDAIADLNNADDATGADLDADGDRDLLLAVSGGAILRNLGNGSFALDGVYEDHILSNSVAAETIDANADGMPDAVLCFPHTIVTRLNHCSPPPPCPADLAPPTGVLDLADIAAFVAGFTGGDPIADLEPDGIYDLADIAAFVTSFNAGCP